MALIRFKCTDFRCIEKAELELDPAFNLIHGRNASGKTSLLEGMAYLGRGRSFRGSAPAELVRHGQASFLLNGIVRRDGSELRLGVQNGAGGLVVSVGGEKPQGAAGLAEALPLQIIDPDVHNLVAGGPEERRRYLDWVTFHVEQPYLEAWRRYRRALKQRNAALREAATREALESWTAELAETGEAVNASREATLDIVRPAIVETAEAMLGSAVQVSYQRGWSSDKTLAEALHDGLERDRQLGSSQIGPHRADLRLEYDAQRARRRVSRGQQKLLAGAMIVAAVEVVQTSLERPLTLLLDDPAAELDSDALARLMAGVVGLGCQVIATALDPERPLFPNPPRLFHVEHGAVTALD